MSEQIKFEKMNQVAARPLFNTDELLKLLEIEALKPPRYLRSGLPQTIFGALWPQKPLVLWGTEKRRVTLDEAGNSTIVLINRPRSWKPGDRVALLAHGLAGSCHSPYITRLARKFLERGTLTIRMNHRNCGPAFGLSEKVYHSGVHDDFRALLKWTAEKFSTSPVTAVGFSLSANTLLKTAAENDIPKLGNLDSLIAISPPVDLKATTEKLSRAPGSWIAAVLLKQLQRDVNAIQKRFSVKERLRFPLKMSMKDFDRIMCPIIGFESPTHYYEMCSSLLHLEKIKIPTLIIGSHDDPMVELSALANAKRSPFVDVVLSNYGGHVGFLNEGKLSADTRWSDDVLLKWLEKRAQIPSSAVVGA